MVLAMSHAGAHQQNTSTITTCVNNSEPYAWYDNKGSLQGVSIEIAKALVKGVDPDMQINFILAPEERCLRLMIEGKVDLLSSHDNSLANHGAQSIGVISAPNLQLWSLAKAPIRNIKEARKKRLVSEYTFQFANENNGLKSSYVGREELLLPMLIAERVDGIIGLEEALVASSVELNFPMMEINRFTIDRFNIYTWIHSNSAHSQNLPAWKHSMESFENGKLIRSIVEKLSQPNNPVVNSNEK